MHYASAAADSRCEASLPPTPPVPELNHYAAGRGVVRESAASLELVGGGRSSVIRAP